jgi:RNA polymerase sigma factor (TIGR02999 family)
MSTSTPPITWLLSQAKAGDEQAAAELMPLIYSRLRLMARARLRREHGPCTLEPTELVHEAYLRFMGPGEVPWHDRLHFFAIAARVMRQVLVDRARSRGAGKRGGFLKRVDLEENLVFCEEPVNFAALDAALTELAKIDARQSRIVELRFFAGLTIQETAEVLGIGKTAVKEEWSFARAWLRRRLEGAL